MMRIYIHAKGNDRFTLLVPRESFFWYMVRGYLAFEVQMHVSP